MSDILKRHSFRAEGVRWVHMFVALLDTYAAHKFHLLWNKIKRFIHLIDGTCKIVYDADERVAQLAALAVARPPAHGSNLSLGNRGCRAGAGT
jgi:hypothetical protein